jgi:hypothetical protein
MSETIEKDTDLLWGAEAIGAAINRSARHAFYLLEAGLLPAKKVGGRWVAQRGKLRAALTEGAAGPQAA